MTDTRAYDVEVDGISLTVRIDPSRDYELIECSYASSDPSATTEQRNRAYFRRNHLLLGDEYGRVMRELREANGGELDTDTVAIFMADVIRAVEQAKNS